MAGNRLKLLLEAINNEAVMFKLMDKIRSAEQVRRLSAALAEHATPPGSPYIGKQAFVTALNVCRYEPSRVASLLPPVANVCRKGGQHNLVF